MSSRFLYLSVKIRDHIAELMLFKTLLEIFLHILQFVIQRAVDIPADRSEGIWILMEMEEIFLILLHRFIHVIKGDLIQRSCDGDAARSSLDFNQSGIPKVRHKVPDDHRVAADAGSKEITGYLFLFAKIFHRRENMNRYRKFG